MEKSFAIFTGPDSGKLKAILEKPHGFVQFSSYYKVLKLGCISISNDMKMISTPSDKGHPLKAVLDLHFKH